MASRNKPYIHFCLVMLLSALIANAAALAKNQQPINFVNQFKDAQDKRTACDNKLFDNMETLADWLIQFRLHKGHFPYVGTEEDNAISYAQTKLLKANPYSVTGVASDDEKKTVCKVRFVHDIGLIDAQREAWEKKAPSGWTAEPGTITVICNEYDNFLIWGAGADHQPIIDFKNNKVLLSWRSFK